MRADAGAVETGSEARRQNASDLLLFTVLLNFVTNDDARDHFHHFGQVGIHADQTNIKSSL